MIVAALQASFTSLRNRASQTGKSNGQIEKDDENGIWLQTAQNFQMLFRIIAFAKPPDDNSLEIRQQAGNAPDLEAIAVARSSRI
jgi:hypothetical protein